MRGQTHPCKLERCLRWTRTGVERVDILYILACQLVPRQQPPNPSAPSVRRSGGQAAPAQNGDGFRFHVIKNGRKVASTRAISETFASMPARGDFRWQLCLVDPREPLTADGTNAHPLAGGRSIKCSSLWICSTRTVSTSAQPGSVVPQESSPTCTRSRRSPIGRSYSIIATRSGSRRCQQAQQRALRQRAEPPPG